MNNYKFQRAARVNRMKALVFTALFHCALIGAVLHSGEVDLGEYLPERVKEWLGMDDPQQPDKAEDISDLEKLLNPVKPVQSEKVGRNAPSPCGSGKKYKKCCG